MLLVQVGDSGLSERSRVQRQYGTDLEDLEGGVGPEDVVDDERAAAMEDSDAHRLLGPQREQLRPGERARA